MTRLTNDIKAAVIRNALVKAGIQAEKAQLELERSTLANDVRIAALGGAENAKKEEHVFKTLMALIEKLQGTIDKNIYISNAEDNDIFPAFGGQRVSLRYGRNDEGKTIYLLTPHQSKCLFPADHELSKRFTQLNEREATIEKKEIEIKANVKAVLDSVTTIKRLISVWPEAKEILPESERLERAMLPAVKVENLNSLIGLPTESEAA